MKEQQMQYLKRVMLVNFIKRLRIINKLMEHKMNIKWNQNLLLIPINSYNQIIILQLQFRKCYLY